MRLNVGAIKSGPGLVQKFFTNYYTPMLMKKTTGIVVLVLFVGVVMMHAVVGPQMDIGLDQKYSMPEDSYVLKYFEV